MTNWISTTLDETHELTEFDCGEPSLDEWLRTRARPELERGASKTYVWAEHESARAVAYYSITPHAVHRGEVPRNLTGGLSTIPSYLLARLALDRSLAGRGLGGELLHDALGRILGAAEVAGGRLVVVDALSDEAAKFYRHHDFKPVRDNPHRLYLKINTLRTALGS